MALLADLIRQDAPGQQVLLDRLLDVNLVFALRSWWAQAGEAAPGWYRALSQPGLRRVLEHVHAEPVGEWTVPAMANLAGMSRAAFSSRFREVTGDSPGSYVTGVRMQRAEDALARSDVTLAQIAAKVGYRNEYAFSTAFRRQARHVAGQVAGGGPDRAAGLHAALIRALRRPGGRKSAFRCDSWPPHHHELAELCRNTLNR